MVKGRITIYIDFDYQFELKNSTSKIEQKKLFEHELNILYNTLI